MKEKKELRGLFCLVGFFVLFWVVLLSFYTPFEIVSKVGINNSYVMLFLVSILDSILTMTYVFSYPFAATLVGGGLNFILLGLLMGFGTTIGDILFFYIGHTGRSILPNKIETFLEKIFGWLARKPQWVLDLGVFIYVGLSPFPNNILTAVGGLTSYPLKKLLWPLIVGNIFLSLLFCYSVYRGFSLFI
tara:strand:- start:189 stop:755 length:567 start_codon:yes stop_codon:yes gene_type:complete